MPFTYLNERNEERLIKRDISIYLFLKNGNYYIKGLSSQDVINRGEINAEYYWRFNADYFVDLIIDNAESRNALFDNKLLTTRPLSLKLVHQYLRFNPLMEFAIPIEPPVAPVQQPSVQPALPKEEKRNTLPHLPPIGRPQPVSEIKPWGDNTTTFFSSNAIQETCFYINNHLIDDLVCQGILHKNRNMLRSGIRSRKEDSWATINYFFELPEKQTSGYEAGAPLSSLEYTSLFIHSDLTAALLKEYFPGKSTFCSEHLFALQRLSTFPDFEIEHALATISRQSLVELRAMGKEALTLSLQN
jgi:hypothetical protein